MSSLIGVTYGIYLVLVGLRGNGPEFIAEIQKEGQFIYWIAVIFILAAIWKIDTGEEFTKPLIALIVIGFLISGGNGVTIINNAKHLSLQSSTGA
jgi:hypothetical protein